MVSSPGFEEYLPIEDPAQLAAPLSQLIGPLQYGDTSRRGCMLLTANDTDCRVDWVHTSTPASHSYTATTSQTPKMLQGTGNQKIVEM